MREFYLLPLLRRPWRMKNPIFVVSLLDSIGLVGPLLHLWVILNVFVTVRYWHYLMDGGDSYLPVMCPTWRGSVLPAALNLCRTLFPRRRFHNIRRMQTIRGFSPSGQCGHQLRLVVLSVGLRLQYLAALQPYGLENNSSPAHMLPPLGP